MLVEGDLQLYAENKEPMEAAFDVGGPASWTTRLLFGQSLLGVSASPCMRLLLTSVFSPEAYNTMKFRGSAVDAGRFLLQWVEAQPELKEPEGLKLFTPIGPWLKCDDEREGEKLATIGHLMRQNALVSREGAGPGPEDDAKVSPR